ncbi:hypothetical protein OESDEN_14249 [Oesophagostomum dentatum]|uniref:Uncharacterized protein n=1 Tax=Oesophagostomum dentatum TaxID=61180 RepID=A0A0B1SL02_OESDE|nr:hypothetical protein OESDEN_14249 [Oesophagostomum dentatum]
MDYPAHQEHQDYLDPKDQKDPMGHLDQMEILDVLVHQVLVADKASRVSAPSIVQSTVVCSSRTAHVVKRRFTPICYQEIPEHWSIYRNKAVPSEFVHMLPIMA